MTKERLEPIKTVKKSAPDWFIDELIAEIERLRSGLESIAEDDRWNSRAMKDRVDAILEGT